MKKSILLSIKAFVNASFLLICLSMPVHSFGQDLDGDGFEEPFDCDDANACSFPGGIEICDNIDNDCDGVVDEDISTLDNDGDGLSQCDGDCDDNNNAINPTATEIPDNGIDEDCNCKDLQTTGVLQLTIDNKMVIGYFDLLGQPCAFEANKILLVQYSDGTYEKINQLEK